MLTPSVSCLHEVVHNTHANSRNLQGQVAGSRKSRRRSPGYSPGAPSHVSICVTLACLSNGCAWHIASHLVLLLCASPLCLGRPARSSACTQTLGQQQQRIVEQGHSTLAQYEHSPNRLCFILRALHNCFSSAPHHVQAQAPRTTAPLASCCAGCPSHSPAEPGLWRGCTG